VPVERAFPALRGAARRGGPRAGAGRSRRVAGRARLGQSAGVLERLEQVTVAVADLAEARGQMAALLGRSPSWEASERRAGIDRVVFQLDRTALELRAPAGAGAGAAALRAHLAERGDGLLGLSYGMADLDEAVAAWRARGLPAPEPTPGEDRERGSGRSRRWRSLDLPRDATRGVATDAVECLGRPLPRAAPLAEEPACVAGVDHVVVASGALDESLRLYRERLGLRLALDRRFERRGLRILFFRVGGVTVEVVGRLAAGSGPRGADEGLAAPAAEGGDRLAGLALQVPRLEAAHARLGDAGFALSPLRDGFKPGTRVCTVRGRPLGVDTLLIQPASRREDPPRG